MVLGGFSSFCCCTNYCCLLTFENQLYPSYAAADADDDDDDNDAVTDGADVDDDVVTLQDVSVFCSLLQLWEGWPYLQRLQGPTQGARAAMLQLRRVWSHGS